MQTHSCGMWDLSPWPGIKPEPPAPGTRSVNHWASREVLGLAFPKAHVSRAGAVGWTKADRCLHFPSTWESLQPRRPWQNVAEGSARPAGRRGVRGGAPPPGTQAHCLRHTASCQLCLPWKASPRGRRTCLQQTSPGTNVNAC